jgi:hypothetical protein
MSEIGLAVTEAVIAEYGTSGFLSRMSDPFWFQALGCVMGMDWHSSGITTSVLGALKRAVNPHAEELGICFCGGRGSASRKTPEELLRISDIYGTDGTALVRASRLSAKVDNTCVQDGFGIYLHAFILDRKGEWTVVQQGMNQQSAMARRYHWHSKQIASFVSGPQNAVVGKPLGEIINMSDRQAEASRSAVLDFITTHPDKQQRELSMLRKTEHAAGFPESQNSRRGSSADNSVRKPDPRPEKMQLDSRQLGSSQLEFDLPELKMPRHHDIRSGDVDSRRLGAVLALAYEQHPASFADALLVQGIGPRTMQSLALVSEVIYGSPCRFSDPARFSFAHGGKDGHPFPVPLKTYDETISILKRALKSSKLGRDEQLQGLKKLSNFSQYIETACAPQADIEAVIRHERADSPHFGGKTVWN